MPGPVLKRSIRDKENYLAILKVEQTGLSSVHTWIKIYTKNTLLTSHEQEITGKIIYFVQIGPAWTIPHLYVDKNSIPFSCWCKGKILLTCPSKLGVRTRTTMLIGRSTEGCYIYTCILFILFYFTHLLVWFGLVWFT